MVEEKRISRREIAYDLRKLYKLLDKIDSSRLLIGLQIETTKRIFEELPR